MSIDSLKGGVEGISAVLEAQKIQRAEQPPTNEDQNNLAKADAAPKGSAQTLTGVAIQGLGENIDVQV